MKTIYLAQINNSYGNNAFLPYSIGMVWGFALTDESVKAGYRLGGMLFLRESIDAVVDGLNDPDVLALSCYIWNWSYNLKLAEAVKARYPACTIVLGGPEVPNRSQGFFLEHGFVDVLVHGEGEDTMRELLVELLGDDPVLSGIDGISYRGPDGSTLKTENRSRISDLDTIPSPYVSGLFDEIVASHPGISFNASQETHRGCPYSCTFCDWGSAVMTKVRQFGTDRLMDELEWFGENRIDLLYNCDANYGIMKRDLELTSAMISVKDRYDGYPSKFRAAYAKKTNERIFEIAKMLNDAGMNKGVTLSMQSTDATTLENVKRSNIRIDDFSRLTSEYRNAGIPTYTELIVGLPGETMSSFTKGLDDILKAGQHDNINVYMCMLLRNSEMSDPSYVEKHGITSKRVPLLSLHGTPSEMDIVEMNDIVVSTNTMPYPEWKKANVLAWMVQCMHCLGLTHFLAMDHDRLRGDYISFYLGLHDMYLGTDTVVGQQLKWIYDQLESVFERSANWSLVDHDYGEVSWPLEEYSFLQIQKEIDRFYEDITAYVKGYADGSYVDQMIDFQRNLLIKPTDRSDVVSDYGFDFISAYHCMQDGNECAIERLDIKAMFYCDKYLENDAEYAKHLVWYGRKSGKTKRIVKQLTDRDRR